MKLEPVEEKVWNQIRFVAEAKTPVAIRVDSSFDLDFIIPVRNEVWDQVWDGIWGIDRHET